MHKAKRNIITTLISQVVAIVCGVIIPRTMISTFGSAAYGLTTSIAQFLSYISLLDGGVARVARAELYEPLAKRDRYEISRVYHAIKHFFAIVGAAFLIYTLILSVVYFDIAQVTEASRGYVFLLIWVISTATLAKYLGGLSNVTLMDADQKQYIGNIVVTSTTILNVMLVVILAKSGYDMLTVKIGSSIVYILQPVCYAIYVRKQYNLPPIGKNRSKLDQKWTGMGQHIAYFLHTNTDVVILTIFADLRYVAVYSVYRLVISSIRRITASFTSGMEAFFGEKIARKEQRLLQEIYFKYRHLLSFTSTVLFGTTAVLIVPFIRLYTAGISDVDYIQPAFAVLLLLSEALDCLIHPCCSLPISANKLRETRWASYGEAAINIILSLILVHWNPLVGLALATLIATTYKSVYYLLYSAKNILCVSYAVLVKNLLLAIGMIAVFALAGVLVMVNISIMNYFVWVLWGVGIFFAVCVMTTLMYCLVYPEELKTVLSAILHKFIRK